MTREEAREELIEEWNEFIDGCGLRGIEEKEAKRNSDFKKVYEANLMAIQALEQEPCDDSISRQAVMDCFKKWQPYMATRLWDFEQELSALPSVNSQPCEDAISRQALLKLMGEEPFNWTDSVQELQAVEDYRNFRNMVEQLPFVKPQEKTGHWVKTPKAVMGEGYMWYCDKCEHQVYQDSSKSYPSEKYCPNCGASMVDEQERSE